MTLELRTLYNIELKEPSIELELRIYGNEMGVLPLSQGVKETMDLP